MKQHASLSFERWQTFSLDQQVLMVANEMHRASKLMASEDTDRRKSAYERVLNLTDLTIRGARRHGLLRELLRLRDVVAGLYVAAEAVPEEHRQALHCLLLFSPVAAAQRPLVS